jgi:hypothetical protein
MSDKKNVGSIGSGNNLRRTSALEISAPVAEIQEVKMDLGCYPRHSSWRYENGSE